MPEKWHDLLDSQLQLRPQGLAFSDTLGCHWTYADTALAVEEMAAQLRSAGVQAGDRVLLLAENCAAVILSLIHI